MELEPEDLELIDKMIMVWDKFYLHTTPDDLGPDEQSDSVIMANTLTELFYKLRGDIS